MTQSSVSVAGTTEETGRTSTRRAGVRPPTSRVAAPPIPTDEVPAAFDAAADRYDVMVALNPGYHKHLRDAADVLLDDLGPAAGLDAEPLRIADLGCGSGASTRALLARLDVRQPGREIELVGVDASAGMLARARRKRWRRGVGFVTGRAEELGRRRTEWGLSQRDAVFAAYLFRNVSARDETLAAVHDLLAPGGTLVVQEYSVAGRRWAQLVWTVVCWLVVVPLALITSRDARIYRYLWRSVAAFDSTEVFMERLQRAGFVDVRTRTVIGWQRGILHTFHARKPR